MDAEQLEFDFYYYGPNGPQGPTGPIGSNYYLPDSPGANGPSGPTPPHRTEDAFDPPKDDVSRPEHYTIGSIEVFDFIKAWELSFAEGNVVKYVVRSPYKGSKLKDLMKARWYLDQLIKDAEADDV